MKLNGLLRIYHNRLMALLYSLIMLAIIAIWAGFINQKGNEGVAIFITSTTSNFQLFYDTGNDFNQDESIFTSNGKFVLPNKPIKRMRLDPIVHGKQTDLKINQIIIKKGLHYSEVFEKNKLTNLLMPLYHIEGAAYDITEQAYKAKIIGNDPYFLFLLSENQLTSINKHDYFIQRITFINLLLLFIPLLILFLFWITRHWTRKWLNRLDSFIDYGTEEITIQTETTTSKNLCNRLIDPFSSQKIFWIFFLIMSFIYTLIYSSSFNIIFTFAMHDDALFYNLANNIANLKWLGEYNSLTLAKVPGYPIFLAFCIATGIPYLLLISVCNVIVISFFIRNVRWIFKNSSLLLFLLGFFLLFNPIFATELRIFRNQLSAICFIGFVGVIASLFNPETERKRGIVKITDAIIAALSCGFLMFTRDEGILFYGIMFLTGFVFLFVRSKIKFIRRNLLLPICGLMGIFLLGISISSLNYFYYGRFTTCERTSAPMTSALKAFHSIDDPKLEPWSSKLTATCDKVTRIAEISSDFKKVAAIMCDTLNKSFQGYSYFDKNDLEFKQVEGWHIPISHFEWYWISCVDYAGYYKDARSLASFHRNLEGSIIKACKEGKLIKRKGMISAGPYSIGLDEFSTIIKIIPLEYNSIFYQPKHFIRMYHDFCIRPTPKSNQPTKIEEWDNNLHLNYILAGDNEKIKQASNSLVNKFWNWMSVLWGITIIPLLHVSIPLSIIAFIIMIVRKNYSTAGLMLIVTMGIIAHYLLLISINVIAGYRGTSAHYFLPSYAALIFVLFISLKTFLQLLQNKRPGKLGQNQTDSIHKLRP